MKWVFTFKNFRNVYWHGKTHSALVSMVFNDHGPLVQRCDGFKISLTSKQRTVTTTQCKDTHYYLKHRRWGRVRVVQWYMYFIESARVNFKHFLSTLYGWNDLDILQNVSLWASAQKVGWLDGWMEWFLGPRGPLVEPSIFLSRPPVPRQFSISS